MALDDLVHAVDRQELTLDGVVTYTSILLSKNPPSQDVDALTYYTAYACYKSTIAQVKYIVSSLSGVPFVTRQNARVRGNFDAGARVMVFGKELTLALDDDEVTDFASGTESLISHAVWEDSVRSLDEVNVNFVRRLIAKKDKILHLTQVTVNVHKLASTNGRFGNHIYNVRITASCRQFHGILNRREEDNIEALLEKLWKNDPDVVKKDPDASFIVTPKKLTPKKPTTNVD